MWRYLLVFQESKAMFTSSGTAAMSASEEQRNAGFKKFEI